MFLKKITIILLSIIFVSSTAFAQTTTSTSGQFTFLEKGDIAPFKGTLFDPVATAKILAEKEMLQKDCQLKIKFDKDLNQAICKRETDLLNSELRLEKRKFNLIVQAQHEEIETLRKLAKGSDNTLWVAIGFGIGAAMSIAIFFAAAEIAK